MSKKSILLIVASSLLLLSIIMHTPISSQLNLQIIKPVKADPKTIIVPTNYTKIQDAINAADPGDTIHVYKGTYYEHVVVNKTVTLIGENRSTTIIDGEGTGIVIRSNASNVEIRGFTIQNGGILDPDSGAYITRCVNNTIRGNIIRNIAHGIALRESNGCSIINNLIVNCSWAGIQIRDSNNSDIHENTMAYNSWGVWITSASSVNNAFYHNNFIDSLNQASDFGSGSIWDDGYPSGGNYWSDYMGVDTNRDGIGDTNTPHLELDYYPLIIPTRPFPVVLDDMIYPVALLSNSTVSRFYFSKPFKRIGFNVTGSSGTIGFCNVTIPLTLMWCDEPEEWQVTVNGNSPAYFPIPTNNGAHTFLYFTYNHSTQNVKITSIYVVPEFPGAIFLPLLIIVTLVAVTLCKRRKEALKP